MPCSFSTNALIETRGSSPTPYNLVATVPVRLKREEGKQNVAFSSRPFVLCGLPVRKPPSNELLYEPQLSVADYRVFILAVGSCIIIAPPSLAAKPHQIKAVSVFVPTGAQVYNIAVDKSLVPQMFVPDSVPLRIEFREISRLVSLRVFVLVFAKASYRRR